MLDPWCLTCFMIVMGGLTACQQYLQYYIALEGILISASLLKVDSNEKLGGWEEDSNSASVWHCGDRGLFAIWTCNFCVKILFPFPLATTLLLGIVSTNRQSGDKMLFLALTAPIYWRIEFTFWISNGMWTSQKIRKIGSALPIQDINYISANMLALTFPFRHTVGPSFLSHFE